MGRVLSLGPPLEVQYFRSRTKGPTSGRIFNPAWINEQTGQEHWEPATGMHKIPKTILLNGSDIIVGGFKLVQSKISNGVLNIFKKFKKNILVAVSIVDKSGKQN